MSERRLLSRPALAVASVASIVTVQSWSAPSTAHAQRRVVGAPTRVARVPAVRVRPPVRYRHDRRLRISVYGGVSYASDYPYYRLAYYGTGQPGFAPPPPECPACPDGCGAPGATEPPAVPVVTAPAFAPPRPELPRFGIGLALGSSETEYERQSDDVAIFGRWNVVPALGLELEIGKSVHGADRHVDRRIGLAAYYDFLPYATVAPYLVGGGGAIETDGAGRDFDADRVYVEGGIGGRWRVSPAVAISLDGRLGRSDVSEPHKSPTDVQSLTTGPVGRERYARVSLRGIYFF
jgi:hypothetical protein